MLTVQVDDAQALFLSILSDVERGERVCIERDGQAIAEIQPAFEKQIDRAQVAEAIEAMKEFRKHAPKLTLEEILAARDEGRA
jgi:antitoxin (DNA-binding transcriptional repressor) of toxin-antitoxin stability system